MTKIWMLLSIISIFIFSPIRALADSIIVNGAINTIQGAESVDPGTLFGSMMIVIQNFGGVGWVLKAACIILLLLAAIKASFLQPLWAKLGPFKAIAAPVLSMLLGILTLAGSGSPITLASLLAFLSTGIGAIGLHEILDMIKAIPGLGPIYVGIIDSIESVLGGGNSPPSSS